MINSYTRPRYQVSVYRTIGPLFSMEGLEALPDFQDKNFGEPLTNIDINKTIIAKAIDKLKASKSQGPDQIHPKLLK